MRILFLCVANSARSQVAEGLARQLFGDAVEIESAGAHPSRVRPEAVAVLKEVGIDISHHVSKSSDSLPAEFLRSVDWVITLCEENYCPSVVSSKARKLHWPIPDPVVMGLPGFRVVREMIREKLEKWGREQGLLK